MAWLAEGEPLAPGRWSVPEPAAPRWVAAEDVDLALVPGLAFDAAGGRLGHGGGYYDRLLARAEPRIACRAGIAWACQIVDRVPTGPHDVRMDWVVTEKEIRRVAPAAATPPMRDGARVSLGAEAQNTGRIGPCS